MDDNDFVLAFDHFYTTNHIQILKSLLPFIDNNSMPNLPVLIKYLELQHTLRVCKNKKTPPVKYGLSACSDTASDSNSSITNNIENIYQAVHKYLAPDEEKWFSQILSAVRTMKNVREMQEMMELFKSLNPDMDLSNFNPGNIDLENLNSGNGMDILNIFKAMNENL